MAGYSFSGENASSTMLCPLCDRVTVFKRGEEPGRCKNCGHEYKKPVTIKTFGSEKAKPSTHKQYRVVCRACNKKSIVWKSKKSIGRPPCPHCGETGKLNVSTINAAGDCVTSSLWGSVYGSPSNSTPKLKPKKKTIVCTECGLNHRYLLRSPERCSRCGREFQ